MNAAAVIAEVCHGLPAYGEELNRLDGVAGDGDLGVTMTSSAGHVLEVLEADGEQPLPELLKAAAMTIARNAPSTAGTLVATGLLRAAAAIPAEGPPPSLGDLLQAAADGIAERGGAEPGSKTMLDALFPAAEAAAGKEDAAAALAAAADAADAGATATAQMRAVHGRAGWLAERSQDHEDAGARFVAIALALAAAVVET